MRMPRRQICTTCGQKLASEAAYCTNCGAIRDTGAFSTSYTPVVKKGFWNRKIDKGSEETEAKAGRKTGNFNVLGEFKPSRKTKAKVFKNVIGRSLITAFTLFIPSLSVIIDLPFSILNPIVLIPIIINVVVALSLSTIPAIISLENAFKKTYIITDSSAIIANDGGKKVEKEFPASETEKAFVVFSGDLTTQYCSLFFPNRELSERLRGNLAQVQTIHSLERNIEKRDGSNSKHPLFNELRFRKKISREIRKRSFLYMDEGDAKKAAQLFNGIKHPKVQ